VDVIHDVTIDLLRPQRTVIRVTQEDSARKIRMTLLADNAPYNVAQGISEEVLAFVEYRKADGTGGMYDTTATGDTAVELEDTNVHNVWLVSLDGNCFTCPGWCQVNVRFETESGKRIHTFAIMVDVSPTASSDTESTDWNDLESIAGLRQAVVGLWENRVSMEAKNALLNLLAHVAYVDEHGQDYYDELETELFRTAGIVSIFAVFDQADNVILDTDDLETLRQYLTVTATYEDLSEREIIGYTLSGTLTEGTSTITVSFGGKTTTFDVSVKHNYADSLANWLISPVGTSGYADGEISIKCNSQSEASAYNVYCADIAKTKWSDVAGKTLKIKIRVRGDNFGEYASDNRLAPFVGIYKNSSIASLGGDAKQRWKSFVANGESGSGTSIAPPNNPKMYEGTLLMDYSAWSGTATPTNDSTFGIHVYSMSLKTAYIDYVAIYEVDAE